MRVAIMTILIIGGSFGTPCFYDMVAFELYVKHLPHLKSSLADDQYGCISWICKVLINVSKDEILKECGLDALCLLLRILQRMGFQISIVGVVCSLFLLPIYATPDEHQVEDPYDCLIVANPHRVHNVPWLLCSPPTFCLRASCTRFTASLSGSHKRECIFSRDNTKLCRM